MAGAASFGTAKAQPACGDTILANTKLSSDLACPGAGLRVGADGVTLDLGGHTISGAATPGNGSVGVHLVGRRGVRVINGIITGFDAGVAIDGGSANTISGLDIHDNIGVNGGDFGDGVAIGVFMPSSRNIVTRNKIDHNGTYEGVGVFEAASGNNVIEDNVISNNNVVRGPASSETTDDGINLGTGVSGSNSTVISNNTIINNGAMGILACSFAGNLCISRYNVIEQNDIEGNGFMVPGQGFIQGAIRITAVVPLVRFPSTADKVIGNRVVNNADTGIFVSTGGNSLAQNVVVGNQAGGSDEDLFDNSINFFGTSTCDHNQWIGNTYGTAFPACTTVAGHQVATASSASGVESSSVSSVAPSDSLTVPLRGAARG